MPRRRPPPKEPTLTEYLRERNKVLRQRESKPLSGAEAAEKLELARLLSRNALTPPQRRYLVDELLRFWFPKAWAAEERRLNRQELADNIALMIRLTAAKVASVADAKTEVRKKTGLQSVEAMEMRMKRARREARRKGVQKSLKKMYPITS